MTSLQFDTGAEPSAPIDMLEHYFSSHDWAFQRDGDEEIVTTVKGCWSDYELRALWREEDKVLQFIALTGINALAAMGEPVTRANLFESLALINEQLWIGHFEQWSADGAILFRHAVLLDGPDEPSLSMTQAHALVDAAIDECERYYPVFQFVVWGGKSPRDALASAMVETEGEA
ncbi:MAG: YbjN domain-containing protein [Sandarakinorhabdus sp.]|nr:YbjN domain-containing protein [Sandarakinorhabdus sp.]